QLLRFGCFDGLVCRVRGCGLAFRLRPFDGDRLVFSKRGIVGWAASREDWRCIQKGRSFDFDI
ncbi:hypothetical protein, partial [Listeria monocytogenes]|uniref:hypothetical protein n=1 Tax=Listeria monocytogenes TaxID=1639 RepID=UPI001A9C36BC